jgi:molecular chaperone GrpE
MPKRHKLEITPAAAAAPAEGAGPQGAQEGALAPPAPERVAHLQQELAAAQAAAQELHDKYLRALADLDNFRRRARDERGNAVRDGEAAILLEVLPVLDNFARAMAAAREANDAQALMDGVKMSYDQLHAALARKGVRPIAAAGKQFDPRYHDAVGQAPTAEQPEGTVMVEVQTGYLHGDRVLRPARVIVAAAAPADDAYRPRREES